MESVNTTSISTKTEANIGLQAEKSTTIVKRLTRLLSDEQVLYTKLRNYHWNVQGMFFQSLHAFFEEQYTELFTVTDDIAERIRSLGHFSIGSLISFLDNARLRESNHLNGNAEEMLSNILNDHEAIIRTLRDDINVTQELGDEGTTDFLVGLMRTHEKMAWMVRSHLG